MSEEENSSSRNFSASVGETLETKELVGTLSAMFLPAKNYKILSSSKFFRIALPLRGYFPTEEGHPFSGEKFDLCPGGGAVLFGDMLKVMFSTGSYPRLEDNQRFVLAAIEVEVDKLVLIGEVIELVE